tara:strand:+ start:1976 stop:2170 length:195 start_codon:yes stop_codon:yes gene_type:complete
MTENVDERMNDVHSQKIEHKYQVDFTIIGKEGNFIDALQSVDSKELGTQIKKLIESENGQYTVE